MKNKESEKQEGSQAVLETACHAGKKKRLGH